MLIRAKRIDNLERKVDNYKNKIVVNYLREKGYECNTTKESMIKVNNLLKTKGQRVVISKQNERLSKVGSYYTWEAYINVKIVDFITGKEI